MVSRSEALEISLFPMRAYMNWPDLQFPAEWIVLESRDRNPRTGVILLIVLGFAQPANKQNASRGFFPDGKEERPVGNVKAQIKAQ